MDDRFVVFTDLDGTLLDHHTYSCAPALPALERLRKNDVPLILTSSKTVAEISELRQEILNAHPIIAENGSVVACPENYFNGAAASPVADATIWSRLMGPDYTQIVELLAYLREEFGYRFEGFSDWDAAQVARETGLSEEDARRAKLRLASEPLRWMDTPERWQAFSSSLERYHLRTVRGGRFDHILGIRADKAHAMQYLLDLYTRQNAGVRWRTIAAGDSPNDLAMLRSASIAVVIPGASGKTLDTAQRDSTLFASEPGPVGWNAAINEILDRFRFP